MKNYFDKNVKALRSEIDERVDSVLIGIEIILMKILVLFAPKYIRLARFI